MLRFRAAAAFLLCCGALSCSTGQRRLEAVPFPPSRIVLKGFSFMPPPESGWLVGGRSDDRVVLGKSGTHLDESFIVSAERAAARGVASQESLIENLRKKSAIGPNDERYRNARQEVAPASIGGAACARYDGEAEDHGALTRSGRRDPMILSVKEVVCLHPGLKDTLVSIGYSHRHYPEDRDPAFPDRARELFESVEFDDR